MKKILIIFSLFLIVANTNAATYNVDSGNYFYLPQSLTVNVGDTVIWNNVGGFHNVNFDVSSITGTSFNNPISFVSSPTSNAFIYSYTFTTPGLYNYDCSVGSHAAFGMIGSITVNASNSIYDIVSNSNDHTTLKVAIDACSLNGVLSDPGSLTLFAPTDAAFNLLPTGTVAALLVDIPLLTDILNYHVVGASVVSSMLSNNQVLTTLLGSDVTVTINGGNLYIDNAMVTIADIVADNGVVHVIDAILLPPVGCTDLNATNYDTNAYLNDGSCSYNCSIDPQYTLSGVYPDSAAGLNIGYVGQSYEQILTIVTPLDTVADILGQSISATIDSLVVTSISGLPNNFSYSCSPPTCSFLGGSIACISIFSNQNISINEIGNYPLTFETTTYVSDIPFVGSLSQNDIIDYYYIDILAGNTISGCMDPNATNYDSTATLDDGSCIYATALTASVTKSDITCNGLCDGTATINASGGCAPYSYQWLQTPQTTQTAINLCAGLYEYIVTDCNGNTYSSSVTITQPFGIIFGLIQNPLTSNGANDGLINIVSIGGGTSPYSYSWFGPNGYSSSSQNLTNLSPGIYNLTITDANGCTSTQSTIISEPNCNVSISSTISQPVCFGDYGYVTWTNSGGGGIYTNTITELNTSLIIYNSLNSSSLLQLSEGTYSLIVTDQYGCVDLINFQIIEPTVLNSSISATDLLCFQDNSGTINSTVSGGVSPYSYLWNNGTTSPNLSVLSSGAYSLTITDNNGCVNNQFITLTEPLELITSVNQTNSLCFGDNSGTINLTVSGGVLPYSYSWSNGATTPNLSGISAGANSVTITDNNGCVNNQFITLTEPLELITSVNQTNSLCFGDNSGTINLTVSGGVLPYSYLWSNGATTPNLSGLAAGVYSVTIIDNNGCVNNQSITLTESLELISSINQTNSLCFGDNSGTINLTASGGVLPYSYLWSNGVTTPNLSALAAGVYTLTITDNIGCQITSSATILEPNLLTVITSTTNVSCNGNNDGSILATASGGSSPYQYSFLGLSQSNGTFSNLTSGTYNLEVTDANGCLINSLNSVVEPDALVVSFTTNDVICYGESNGSLSVSATGGTVAGSYVIDYAGINPSAISQGTYVFSLTDDNGCSSFPISPIVYTIGTAADIISTITATNPSCNGGSNGTAAVNITGGTGLGTYSYLWNDASSQTTATAINLSAGNYSCIVTDVNGCTPSSGSALVVIGNPTSIAGTITKTNVTCYGDNDGTATVIANGGTGSLGYLWSDGQTTSFASGLVAGNYTCIINDGAGCNTSLSVTITEPPVLTSNLNITDASCYGSCDGTASVFASAGSLPYSYLWANGQTSQTEVNLCAGTYFVDVTDNNGCQITSSVTISEPPVLTANFTQTDVSCFGYCDGTASVFASGGSLMYNYLWGNGGTTNIQTNLCVGTYPCTVIDANGCTMSTSISIFEPTEILPNITLTDVTCVGLSDADATVNPTGGSSIYNVQWFNGLTSNSISNLGVGTYNVIITDNTGCSSSLQPFTIVAPDPLYVNAFSSDISCLGYCDGSAFSMPSGGISPYSINWSNGLNGLNISGLCTGTYIANITDANNCVNIETVVISEPLTLVSNVTINGCDSVLIGTNYYTTSGAYTDTLTSVNGCDSVVNTNLTIEQYIYSYDTLSVNSSIVWNGMSLNTSGDYSVNLVNSLGCDSIANLNLTVTITGILDITNNKNNLVKITDMLGQETPYRRNTPLFYIYDDGTVERRIVIE